MNKEHFERLKNYADKIVKHEFKTTYEKGVCKSISIMASEILNELGYNCHIQRVAVIVSNEIGIKALREMDKTGNYNTDYIKDGGWSIGLGYPTKEKKGYEDAFHYIVYFPEEKEVLDLTFSMANRPEKNIIAEAYWTHEDELPESIHRMMLLDLKDNSIPLIEQNQEMKKRIIERGIKYVGGETDDF